MYERAFACRLTHETLAELEHAPTVFGGQRVSGELPQRVSVADVERGDARSHRRHQLGKQALTELLERELLAYGDAESHLRRTHPIVGLDLPARLGLVVECNAEARRDGRNLPA